MRVVVACVLLLASVPLAAQRPASFLSGAEVPEGTIETRHLQAQVVGDVRIAADGTGSVTLAVTPAPRMHIYAHDAEGYLPFRLDFEPRADLAAGTTTYPASELSVFAPTGETSNVYTRPFRVTRGFTARGRLREQIRTAAQGTPLTLTLRYQACDDRVCYRPEQRNLVVTVRPR